MIAKGFRKVRALIVAALDVLNSQPDIKATNEGMAAFVAAKAALIAAKRAIDSLLEE